MMFDYGAHGFYIALAYGAGALVFLWLGFEPLLRASSLQKKLRAHIKRMAIEEETRSPQ